MCGLPETQTQHAQAEPTEPTLIISVPEILILPQLDPWNRESGLSPLSVPLVKSGRKAWHLAQSAHGMAPHVPMHRFSLLTDPVLLPAGADKHTILVWVDNIGSQACRLEPKTRCLVAEQ